MDLFPARISSHIDRLVLGLNRQVGPRHGRVLNAIAHELGLDSLKLIPHFADFWLDGPIALATMEARLPYAPAGTIDTRLSTLLELGLVTRVGEAVAATDRFRPLLAASIAAREEVVARTWEHAPTTEAEEPISLVTGAVDEFHIVAAAHRDLAPAPNPLLRLYDRLVTLRYPRQHDHVQAWRSAGMTAEAMKVLTPLWYQESSPDEGPGWAELEDHGLVEEGRLTERGRRLRELIEMDTNRGTAATWSALGVDEREHVIDLLTRIPDVMPSAR